MLCMLCIYVCYILVYTKSFIIQLLQYYLSSLLYYLYILRMCILCILYYICVYSYIALSQKGDPVESFKVLSVRSTTDQATGRGYYEADIRYTYIYKRIHVYSIYVIMLYTVRVYRLHMYIRVSIRVYSYALNTQAGFLVDRKGVASITSVGPNIQVRVTLLYALVTDEYNIFTVITTCTLYNTFLRTLFSHPFSP